MERQFDIELPAVCAWRQAGWMLEQPAEGRWVGISHYRPNSFDLQLRRLEKRLCLLYARGLYVIERRISRCILEPARMTGLWLRESPDWKSRGIENTA